MLAIRSGDNARLLSRRGNNLTDCFPEIAACLRDLPNIALDGELIVLDSQGKPDFERLRRRALIKKSINVQHAARIEPAAIFAFDVLMWRGKDVRQLPLLKRKEMVDKALKGSSRIRAVQYVCENGERLYEAASGLQLEGIIAKLQDAPYRAGRSKDWIKIRTPHGRHVQDERSERWIER